MKPSDNTLFYTINRKCRICTRYKLLKEFRKWTLWKNWWGNICKDCRIKLSLKHRGIIDIYKKRGKVWERVRNMPDIKWYWRTWEYKQIFKEYYWDIKECQKCKSNFHLQIHHIDKNWLNNEPHNLIKLCLICHTNAHKWDVVYRIMIKRLNFILWINNQ